MTWHSHNTLDWILVVLALLAFLAAAVGVKVKSPVVLDFVAVGLFLSAVVLFVV